jgi:TonB family protein
MNSSRLKFRSIITLSALVGLLHPASILAQGSSAFLGGNTGISTAAVDAKRVRYRAENYPGKLPPWLNDRVKAFAPDYPYVDRAHRNEEVGLFRLSLDLKTGGVSKVTILKSTGFRSLDNSAVASFRHWSWKPGKWREIDIPIKFEMATGPPRLPPGAVRLP